MTSPYRLSDGAIDLPPDPEVILPRLVSRRVLLFGDTGTGKSTLARLLAARSISAGLDTACISADPGTPSFGPPGAAALAEWDGHRWDVVRIAPLCTLDAVRFRLPLVQAVAELGSHVRSAIVLVDAPGVVRGVAGAELLEGLVRASVLGMVLVLVRRGEPVPLARELTALGVPWLSVCSSAAARRPSARIRAEQRTAQWERWLGDAMLIDVPLADLRPVGTPPPVEDAAAWHGRQVGWSSRTGWAMGEVVALRNGTLTVRARTIARPSQPESILVRDARRGRDGWLVTAPRHAPVDVSVSSLPSVGVPVVLPITSPPAPRRPVLRAGALTAMLVNGVYGDPLVHVRFRFGRRALLFDLGDAERLSVRELNAVSDVCITHCHIDHVAGFLRLLRARLAAPERPCRIFGPPGTAARLANLVGGIHWDRIGGDAPLFEVADADERSLQWTRIRPGAEPAVAPPTQVVGGVLADLNGTLLRATMLDHGIPVLAYAVELPARLEVRRDRLDALCAAPGRWLGELKSRFAAGDEEGKITLPDGRREPVGALGRALLSMRPGLTVAYASDLGDTDANRHNLIEHARSAEVLFLEAPFRVADGDQAARTHHLTTRACGEIAAAAQVSRLVPFHFSNRYEGDPDAVYAEIATACRSVRIER
jgi:ribonuclease Z